MGTVLSEMTHASTLYVGAEQRMWQREAALSLTTQLYMSQRRKQAAEQ